MLVFVFGTLISGFNNHRILAGKTWDTDTPPAKFVGPCTTVGFFKMRDVGFPYIKKVKSHSPGKAYRVRGECWDIGDPATSKDAKAMLEAMDRLEGYRPDAKDPRANHYTREELQVMIDGEEKPRTANYYQATQTTWERAAHVKDAEPIDGVLDWAARNSQRRNPDDIAKVQAAT